MMEGMENGMENAASLVENRPRRRAQAKSEAT